MIPLYGLYHGMGRRTTEIEIQWENMGKIGEENWLLVDFINESCHNRKNIARGVFPVPKKVRLIDIAEKTGVSVGTVSYVLNNANVSISKEVKERVLAAAAELHYTTNWAAKGLKMQHNNAIGVIVEDMLSWYISPMIDGISRYAEEADVRVLLCNLRADSKVTRLDHKDLANYRDQIAQHVRNTFGNQVDALLYIGAFSRDVSDVFIPENDRIIYVYCHCGNSEKYASIRYNDYQGGRLAAEYLLEKGHRKIAYIDALHQTIPAMERLNGLRDRLRERGLDIPEQWTIDFLNRREGEENVRQLLMAPDRPTALFCNTDRIGRDLYDICSECGFSIPRDISVIGFDNDIVCGYLHPQLTSIGFSADQIGYEATKLICQEEQATGQRLMDCYLIERDSVASLR